MIESNEVFPVEFLVDVITGGSKNNSGKSITENEAANILGDLLLTGSEEEVRFIEDFFLTILEDQTFTREVRFIALVHMKDLSSLITNSASMKLAEFEADPTNADLVVHAERFLMEQQEGLF